MRCIELLLSDSVLTAATGALIILAIIVATIVTEELRIHKQISEWKERKEDKPILDVWGDNQARIQVSAKDYLESLLTK